MRNRSSIYIESDDSGSLISVSDMMSALLFVFIITLAAFIIKFQDAADRKDAIVEEMTSVEKQRSAMLARIKEELEKRGILVQIDQEHGVLRLREDAVQFETARATLAPPQQSNLQTIGTVLWQVLPCYTSGARRPADCPAGTTAQLDSILLEGHTDNVPINNSLFQSNWELSAQRAIETYRILERSVPRLLELENSKGERLFSVSGYGDNRPLVSHDVPTPNADNRRIDLRFIMAPPQVVDPQREALEAGLR